VAVPAAVNNIFAISCRSTSLMECEFSVKVVISPAITRKQTDNGMYINVEHM